MSNGKDANIQTKFKSSADAQQKALDADSIEEWEDAVRFENRSS